jgi:hypothetical protein
LISVKVRLLVGLLLAPLVGGGAQATAKAKSATKPTARPATVPATVPDSDAVATAYLAAETRAYAQQLTQWRRAYLARASWADLGDRCNPGALRVFTNDTTPALQAALQATVERMEQAIVLQGVGRSLATPEARALLRVVVGWEAGIDRPRWDEDGAGVHRAVATGLTGDVPMQGAQGAVSACLVLAFSTISWAAVHEAVESSHLLPTVDGTSSSN